MTIHAVRVLDCTGNGPYSAVIAGVDWVTANHASPAVANMSLGGGVYEPLDTAVRNSIASGVTYAIAAGKDYGLDASQKSPARVVEALTVANSTVTDTMSGSSNGGAVVDLFAPGTDITSAWIGSDTATNTITGTSMASPHVAGVAALYLQANPGAAPATVNAAVVNNTSVGKISNIFVAGTPNRLLYSVFPSAPPRVLTVASSNPASGVSVAVSPNDNNNQGGGLTQFTRTYGHNTVVTLNAPPFAGGNTFQKWLRDGLDYSSNASTSVTMDADHTLTAVYVAAPVQVTVQTNPAGRSFTVDGTTYVGSQTFTWAQGSSHTIGTTSPQGGGEGTQYVWSGWSDGGAITHTVAPTGDTTYTANFTTQYFLTMNAGAGGTVSPQSGWFNSGQVVGISAAPNSGFVFSGWSGAGAGSFTGTSNPASVTMNGPISETASFSGGAARQNVALASNGATATTSSTLDAGRTPLAAINGDRKGLHWGSAPATGSGWHDSTHGVYPDWLQVDFAGQKTINEVNVFSIQDDYPNPVEPTDAMTFAQYGVTAFEVQYWTGAAWVTVSGGSVTGNDRIKRTFTFAPLTTDRVRVLVNNALAGYSRLVEVEVY